jgi:hypothetical protein
MTPLERIEQELEAGLEEIKRNLAQLEKMRRAHEKRRWRREEERQALELAEKLRRKHKPPRKLGGCGKLGTT